MIQHYNLKAAIVLLTISETHKPSNFILAQKIYQNHCDMDFNVSNQICILNARCKMVQITLINMEKNDVEVWSILRVAWMKWKKQEAGVLWHWWKVNSALLLNMSYSEMFFYLSLSCFFVIFPLQMKNRYLTKVHYCTVLHFSFFLGALGPYPHVNTVFTCLTELPTTTACVIFTFDYAYQW